MNYRIVSPIFAIALLAAPLDAQGSRSFDVCGGNNSAFATCASVGVDVFHSGSAWRLRMTIYNMSGNPLYPTIDGRPNYSGTVFTSIGMDNVVPASINVAATPALSFTGACYDGGSVLNPSCDYSSFWTVKDDKAIGGGVKVDLLPLGGTSQYSIASSCGVDDATLPGHGQYMVTNCTGAGDYSATVEFSITGGFDPNATGHLFVKGQNGLDGQSTQLVCDGRPDCSDVTTVIPEPATVVLLLSGLGVLGVVARRRGSRKPLT